MKQLSNNILKQDLYKTLIEQDFKKSSVPFPIDAFPKEISSIINHTKEALLFPVDFTGTSLLVAGSIALGSQYRIKVKEEFIQSASLYCAIVGNPGVNKSAPLKFIFSPLAKKHEELHNEFIKEKERYNRLSDEEKEFQPKPKVKGLLLSDSTFESVIKFLENNPHGIGIYNDELASWLKNFSRYNSGSDNEYWLSIWSNSPLNKTRASEDPIYVDYPFASVIGTIQIDVLKREINKISENGFFDRFIYAYPKNLKKQSWKEFHSDVPSSVVKSWRKTIEGLYNIRSNQFSSLEVKTNAIPYSEEGMEMMVWYQEMLTNFSNQTNSNKVKGILAKLELITVRICLILEAMECAINKTIMTQISLI